MIKLQKSEIPEILKVNGVLWTEIIRKKLEGGEVLSDSDKLKYNKQEIKEALVEETRGKCAYCESKMRHVTWGDIEHIVPKSIAPLKCYEWSNLTLACSICNTSKGNVTGLLNPYEDDPDGRVVSLLHFVLPGFDDECAGLTVKKLDLNRADLLSARKDKLESIQNHWGALMRIIQLGDESASTFLEDFFSHLQDDKEYSAMARSVWGKDYEGFIKKYY